MIGILKRGVHLGVPSEGEKFKPQKNLKKIGDPVPLAPIALPTGNENPQLVSSVNSSTQLQNLDSKHGACPEKKDNKVRSANSFLVI